MIIANVSHSIFQRNYAIVPKIVEYAVMVGGAHHVYLVQIRTKSMTQTLVLCAVSILF